MNYGSNDCMEFERGSDRPMKNYDPYLQFPSSPLSFSMSFSSLFCFFTTRNFTLLIHSKRSPDEAELSKS